MENVEKAALPPGWAWTRLGDISAVSGGLTKNRSRNTSGMTSALFLRVAYVQSGYVDLEDLHLIEASTQEIERLSLRRGDMLVVEGNGSLSQVGRYAIWDNDVSDCIHQNHIIRVRLNKPEQANWVFRWLSSQHRRTFIERSANSISGLHTCLVPACGDTDHQAARDKLWDRFYTAAPARRRRCVSRFSVAKRV